MIDLYAESWESVLPRPARIEGRRRSVSTAGTPRLVLRYSTRALRSSVSILWNTIICRAAARGAAKRWCRRGRRRTVLAGPAAASGTGHVQAGCGVDFV